MACERFSHDVAHLFQLIDINPDGHVSLMDEKGEMREDLKLPEGDLGREIKEKFEKDEDAGILVSTKCYPLFSYIKILYCQSMNCGEKNNHMRPG